MRVIEMIIDRITGKAPKGAKRSKEWRKVRDKYIAENPECAVCGRTDNLVAHHIIPFWLDPSRELDAENNLITLCERRKVMNCHLIWGHLGNWKGWNTNIYADVAYWSRRFK